MLTHNNKLLTFSKVNDVNLLDFFNILNDLLKYKYITYAK